MKKNKDFDEKKELLSEQVKELMHCASKVSLYIETVKSKKWSVSNLSRIESELNETTIKLSSAVETLNCLKYIIKTQEPIKEIYIDPTVI